MIDLKTAQALEFDKILEILSSFAVSERARQEILHINSASDMNEAQRLLDTTEEMYMVYHKYNLSPIAAFDDITEPLKKCSARAILNPAELLKIARLIRSARIAKKELASVGSEILYLSQAADELQIAAELEKAIGDSIASDCEIKDSASDVLRALRRKIAAADNKLKEKLSSYIRSPNLTKFLQDAPVTVRNGRFVLPVKSEWRGEIGGLIHDQSSSGATVFIEPFPIVELNNELKSLQLEEAAEIERILMRLSEITASCAENLDKCQSICTMLDITCAKMRFSCDIKGIKPALNCSGNINLIESRHPLIARDVVVPVTLKVGKDYKLLLITGPNTGGKTVCLKTAGLFCVMACAGLYLPCGEGSEAAVFDRIFCDIGDDQSILNSLSTFSSHIVNIAYITHNVTNRSLVLLDELGSGTDPSEGAALAFGIIRHLERAGVTGVITTHYGELKQYAVSGKIIQNGCMQFDDATLKPTYKLLYGIPGASHALKIASSLGLCADIIKDARTALGGEKTKFEDVLAFAEKAKSEAIAERAEAAALRKQAEEETAFVVAERTALKEKMQRFDVNVKSELKRISASYAERANELIQDLTQRLKQEDERALIEAKRLRGQIETIQYAYAPEEVPQKAFKPLAIEIIKIGMSVFIPSLDCEAVVTAMPDKREEVALRCGSAQFKMHLSKLAEAEKKNVSNKKTPSVLKGTFSDSEAISGRLVELKVIGLTVSEAIELIEPHIMSGILSGSVLKIIHGKGTGALGKGIQQYLRSLKGVKSVRYGAYGEGERGVTIAEF